MRYTPAVLASIILTLPAAPACTPADRQHIAAVVTAAEPAVCALVSLLAADGTFAGSVCSDVAGAFSAGLKFARIDTAEPTVTRASSTATGATCTPLRLVDLDPHRSPLEYVCAEVYSTQQARNALGIGHAR